MKERKKLQQRGETLQLITVISILGIWEVISLEDVMRKIFTSLFVIFVASVIVLFIFSVLIKDSDKD